MFITFEGPDGGGKTTQVAMTVETLKARGLNVLLTREPGGTDIGNQIRHVLHDMKNHAMHPRTELLMYSASRAQIVEEVIKPHMAKGGLVICDRFFDSTYAYQGYGHGLDLNQLKLITEFATGGLKPDLTVLLDIAPEDSLQRRLSSLDKGGEWNRLDAMAIDFHKRVREGYHALVAADPKRWEVVNAAQSVEKVQTDILAVLEKRLESRKK
ncbi:MAG: dTMP kinase [Anaerolineae bacterium]|nr:dTMP kinase [Anaerolineae bacterium]